MEIEAQVKAVTESLRKRTGRKKTDKTQVKSICLSFAAHFLTSQPTSQRFEDIPSEETFIRRCQIPAFTGLSDLE
jgi:hypothetical protein